MKLALMCRNAELYSHKRIVEAAEDYIVTADGGAANCPAIILRPALTYRGFTPISSASLRAPGAPFYLPDRGWT